MLREQKKHKRRLRLNEKRNRVVERLVVELQEERRRLERQREMYTFLSRKYYDRWRSILKTKVNRQLRKPICMPEQRKVRIDRLMRL